MILFILFYQEKSKNSSDFKHVYIYQVTVLTLIVNMQTYLFGYLIAVKCTFHQKSMKVVNLGIAFSVITTEHGLKSLFYLLFVAAGSPRCSVYS